MSVAPNAKAPRRSRPPKTKSPKSDEAVGNKEPCESASGPYSSTVMAFIHDAAVGLYEGGHITEEEMRQYDNAALTSLEEIGPDDIRAMRGAADFSPAVLARVLNVSVETVRGWEAGEGKPRGPVLKLLCLAKSKGMASIM
ncbi:hypothetical protein BH11ARM2_BH11ARM2_29070 [soil metagenome]